MSWPAGAVVRPKFEGIQRSPRIRCVVCGRSGSLGGTWQRSCQAGHPHRCPLCGRRFSSLSGLRHHEDHAMRGHDGCPPSPLFLGQRPVLLPARGRAVS